MAQVRACAQGDPGIHVSSGCRTEAPWQMINTADAGSSHSEGWTSEIKMSADLMSDENPLPGSQMVSPHCILTWRKGRNPVMRLHPRDLLAFQRPRTFQSIVASKWDSSYLNAEGEVKELRDDQRNVLGESWMI